MRPTLIRSALMALVALGLTAANAPAQAKKSDSVVKVTAKADKPDADGKQMVTLTIAIDEGWHIYANPVEESTLKSVETTVKVTTKVDDAQIKYPEGKLIKDAVVGDYRIYKDTVTIKATVKRTKGDTEALKLSVKIQSCSDKVCLLPATIKLTAE